MFSMRTESKKTEGAMLSTWRPQSEKKKKEREKDMGNTVKPIGI